MILTKKQANRRVIAIHNEIDTATERLLTQARNIISQDMLHIKQSEQEKADILKTAGFANCKIIKDIQEKEEILGNQRYRRRSASELANLIVLYQRYFPFYKFLTVDELLHVCLKYDLVFHPVVAYIGDIPEKNIKELANIPSLNKSPQEKIPYENKSKDVDPSLNFSPPRKYFIEMLSWGSSVNSGHIGAVLGNKFEVPEQCVDSLLRNGVSHYTLGTVITTKLGKSYGDLYNASGKLCEESTDSLYIAAPPSMFDKKLVRMNPISRIINTFNTDPIVFRKCKGGIQVITKWGLEGSDPLLVNQIEN